MKRICPKPPAWNKIYRHLVRIAASRVDLVEPPVPLILGGWIYSNDTEKMNRWLETVQWAQEAGCDEILASLKAEDFYSREVLSDHEVGPEGIPMYRQRDFERKDRPEESLLTVAMMQLTNEWPMIAAGLSECTRPLFFSGDKARRLVVAVLSDTLPPWGQWHDLSSVEAERRTFTAFRKAVNEAISPHEVDHIDFIKEQPK
jgi:hypothetical protein